MALEARQVQQQSHSSVLEALFPWLAMEPVSKIAPPTTEPPEGE